MEHRGAVARAVIASVSVASTDAAAKTVTLRLRKPTEQTMWPFPATFPTRAEQVSEAFRHRAVVASGKGFATTMAAASCVALSS
jgi:hypothetical protein